MRDENILFHDTETPSSLETHMTNGDMRLCSCKIIVENNIWTVTLWYSNPRYLNQGFGYQTMRHTVNTLCRRYGKPYAIKYMWDGANEYVMRWLQNHFSPKPISFPKTENDKNEFTPGIYELDKDKFFDYFNIRHFESL